MNYDKTYCDFSKKLIHQTYWDAAWFQQFTNERAGKHKKFWVYYCSKCGFYHVSTKNFYKKIEQEYKTEIVQNIIEEKDVTLIRKLSNKYSIWAVKFQGYSFCVKYNSKKKHIEVLKELY